MELSQFYQELLPALNKGVVMSIALIVPSAIGGVCIGITVGALRTFGPKLVQKAGP